MKTKILPVLAVVSLATTIFYLLFMLFYNQVHFLYPPVDENKITPWLRSHLSPSEGIEAYFMFFGMIIYLGLVYLLLKKMAWFSNRLVQIMLLIPLILIIIRTRSEIFSFSRDPWLNFILIVATLSLLYISYLFFKFKKSKPINTLIFVLLWVLFAGLVFLSMDLAAPFSYSFIIAPTLKLIQGESLNSFQISYGMPLTLLFTLLLKLKLQLTQMHLIFGAIFIVWYGFYFYLASKLIKDRFLLFLFMVTLIAFRFFVIKHDPNAIVEVTPLRLEVWVPLLIIVYRFGLLSLITSFSFALVYLLDNFFGAIYLAVYLIMVIWIMVKERKKFQLKSAIMFLPILLSFLLRFSLFGSLFSQQAQLYQHLRLYFQPISNRSVFWVILPIFGLYLSLVSKEKKDNPLRNLYLLLLGLGVVQLLYFYGASLDHNLLNISGIFILMLFISLNYLAKNYRSKKVVYLVASLLIVFSSVSFTRFLLHKLDQVRYKISTGQIIQTHPLDLRIDSSPKLFDQKDEKVFLISSIDGYYNYRYNFPQVGFNTPFHANIFIEDTVKNLLDLKNKGYRLILWERVMLNSLRDFNESNFLKKKNMMFKAIDKGEYLELELVKRGESQNLVKTSGWRTYQDKEGIIFNYPPKWSLKKEGSHIILEAPNSNLFVIFDGPVDQKNLNRLDPSAVLQDDKHSYGKLINQGEALIPNFDKAYVRVWEDRQQAQSTKQILEFFLFKNTKLVKVVVYPASSDRMIQFESIITSLKIT
ncbi:hypothetical protein HYS91_03105 [Candidatus Daviesbacteria bacterium]|nr:hypothetical protein [Candidatus Daviesbacteria bacterium]